MGTIQAAVSMEKEGRLHRGGDVGVGNLWRMDLYDKRPGDMNQYSPLERLVNFFVWLWLRAQGSIL